MISSIRHRRRRFSDQLSRPSAMRPGVLIAAVSVAGAIVTADSVIVHRGELHQVSVTMVMLAIGMLIGELFPVRVRRPGAEGEVTPSTTFAFALVLIAGYLAVPLIVLVSLVCDRMTGKSAIKVMFNAGQYALTVFASATVLALLIGPPLTAPGVPFHPADLAGVLVAGFVFFAVNSFLVASVIALIEQQSVLACLSDDLRFQATSAGLLLGLAPMVVVSGVFSPLLIPLFVLPLLSIVQGQRQALQKEHESIHDALTGLPNRVLFAERVAVAMRTAQRDGNQMAVMVLDLDGFKEINDTLGHHKGDQLLKIVAERLQERLREDDVVARLGGDEFGILLPSSGDAEAITVANKLHRCLREALQFGDLELRLGGSIGIALFPSHGSAVGELLQRADIAMYRAKRQKLGVEVYDPAERLAVSRAELSGELERALELGQLVPYFQPKLETATGRVAGVEALTRWEHPTRGLLLSGEFIPLAEQSGLVIRLTELMLEQALRVRTQLLRHGHELTVAVNLSPLSLLDQRLPERIARVLKETGTPAGTLELEITESMLMADPERATRLLHTLREIGVLIAIDDFGTGYSSLERLGRLPLDAVKIDKSFVIGMEDDPTSAMIVQSTVDLGHHLGLRVVAEGVEDERTAARLAEMGCDFAQGFHLSPPLSAKELWMWLEDRAEPAVVPPVAVDWADSMR